MLRYLIFLAVIFGVQSALAPFITPCKSGDNDCAIQSAQAAVPIVAPGIPELGIKPLDPLPLRLVKGDSAGLQLTLKDSLVKGMRGCKVEGIRHDLTKKKQSLTIKCTVQLTGDYKLDGQILVLPIRGEGKYVIDILEQFLNSNWRDVMKEVAPPIVYAIVEAVVEGVESIYKAVPAEELSIS
ncbi:DUF233 protein [Operophtera brumata]|uniref:DUF233 protein n=1 Tax=Operophtera brumata TaxID=104452 RepID=A0A0L7KZM0_OPEBR|nr:DUF233 protein [Operophtera brumata]